MSVARKRWTALLLVVVGLVGCSADRESRSVILITIDTLRADHLSGTGYALPTSPVLDAFARRGTRFKWAFSTCSYTAPSHASMFVGMYPSFHSVGLINGQQKLRPEETTLAEILRDAGWRTAAIVSNGVLARSVGLDQGFESYDDRLPDWETVRKLRERRASNAVDQAVTRLDELRQERFFLWLHLQDPHGPYTPPEDIPALSGSEASDAGPAGPTLPIGKDHSGFRAIPIYQAYGDERKFEEYRARYDREIRFLDTELGRLFTYLDRHQLLESTLVIITADHGEAMGEDGFYFSHGHSVGLDQINVPLIFVGQGVQSDRVVASAVSNMSVFATVLEYLGQPIPPGIQSQSLFASLTDGAEIPPRPIFTESFTQRGVAYAGHYLRADRQPAANERFWRTSPVSGGYIAPLGRQILRLGPAVAKDETIPAKLGQQIQDFSRSAETALQSFRESAVPSEIDPERLEELRALGYAE